jgi:hypothetical protein
VKLAVPNRRDKAWLGGPARCNDHLYEIAKAA